MKRFYALLCAVLMVVALGANSAWAAVETKCTDGRDNDRDGKIDCLDTDCAANPACAAPPTTETNCTDGIDNDNDTRIDCADTDCATNPACAAPTTETNCTDGLDNDNDTRIDCADTDCAANPACASTTENCKDGIDNDLDAKIDCADTNCTGTPECSGLAAHRNINSYNGPSTCIACHTQAGTQMMNSVHGSWLGATPDVPNIVGNAGKWGSTNNYCTDASLADYACLKCHVSLVGPPGLSTAADMDCLQCHQNKYEASFNPTVPLVKTNCVDGGSKTYMTPAKDAQGKYKKVPRFDLMPVGTTMIELARTVHRPDNASCVTICHSDAGGGDGIKRGDIDSVMANPPVTMDVHLSSAGTAQMKCTSCHVASNHQIPGRGSDLHPTDTGATMKNCVDCHTAMASPGGHASLGKRSEPDRHIARVDCTACHIKAFGKGVPTEMTRDWTLPKWSAGGCEGQGAWVGTTTKGANVVPEFKFWTGDSWVYDRQGSEGLSPDPNDNNTLRFSYPIGDANNGKLYPFKVHVSKNPVENNTNMTNFDVLDQFFTGCYDRAARTGLNSIGATGAYTWKTTKDYQLITHGIGPSAEANDCLKCHHGTGQFTPTFETKLDKLGYSLKDGDGNGIINDNDRLIICGQCHAPKTFPRDWERMHGHTLKGSGIDCYFCHDIRRPERNLCDPCDPACVAEFVDTTPFPHQCP